ncbi:MAG: helix-turn-helix transcriptional regulator [Rhodospirillaceae bacterium]|nr:helix-turn-helix transcriptional regulator [Rhodospirillaceae bacterium]
MSVRELKAALGIGSDKVRDATNQAIDHGFLIRRQQGSFSVKNRSATEWEITAEACDGAPPKCLYRDYDKNLRNLRQVQMEPEAGTVPAKKLPNITRTEPVAGTVKACFGLPTEPETGSLIESTRQVEVSHGQETRSKPDADRVRARLKAGKASAPKGFMAWLARETGISGPSLANFAAGRFPISAERLARLSAALDAREAA